MSFYHSILFLSTNRFIKEGEMKSEYPIVIGGENFGCGSSREHAPVCMGAAGTYFCNLPGPHAHTAYPCNASLIGARPSGIGENLLVKLVANECSYDLQAGVS